MIQKLGKPAHCQTFADYAEKFTNNVLGMFQGSVTRVDIVFDRYLTSESTPSRLQLGKSEWVRELDPFVR